MSIIDRFRSHTDEFGNRYRSNPLSGKFHLVGSKRDGHDTHLKEVADNHRLRRGRGSFLVTSARRRFL